MNINSSYSADVKKAVLALKVGEVTDPLRQSNAFYIIRVEEKTIQPMGEVTDSISEEIRGAHLNQWLAEVGKRFEPTVKSVEFFTQPKLALPGAAGPGNPPRPRLRPNRLCSPGSWVTPFAWRSGARWDRTWPAPRFHGV